MLNNKNNKINPIPPPPKQIEYKVQYRPRGISYIPIEKNENTTKIKTSNTIYSKLLDSFTFGLGSSVGTIVMNKIFNKNNSNIYKTQNEERDLQEECDLLFEDIEKCIRINDYDEENECSKKFEEYYKKCKKIIDNNYLMNSIKNKE